MWKRRGRRRRARNHANLLASIASIREQVEPLAGILDLRLDQVGESWEEWLSTNEAAWRLADAAVALVDGDLHPYLDTAVTRLEEAVPPDPGLVRAVDEVADAALGVVELLLLVVVGRTTGTGPTVQQTVAWGERRWALAPTSVPGVRRANKRIGEHARHELARADERTPVTAAPTGRRGARSPRDLDARLNDLRSVRVCLADDRARVQRVLGEFQRARWQAAARERQQELERQRREAARREADARDARARQAASLRRRVDELHRELQPLHARLTLSSRELRAEPWASAFADLVRGTRVGTRLTDGYSREEARRCLGLVRLVGSLADGDGAEAAAALRDLLRTERELSARAAALRKEAARLPADARLRELLAACDDRLAGTWGWVGDHHEALDPVLRRRAGGAWELLGQVRRHLPPG
jgi:hypothetical protein